MASRTKKKPDTAKKPVRKPRAAPAPAPKKAAKPRATLATAPKKPAPVAAKPTKLATWREMMGYTRAEVAAQIDVTVPYYGRIENGLCWPRPVILANLLKFTKGAVTAGNVLGDLAEIRG